MERGLYIAAAGMVAEMVRQDQIANDLANSATPGYKSDRSQQQSFSDLLLQNTQTGETIGKLGQGPLITKKVTDLTPEALRDTGEPLDLGIAGPGYFAVQTDKGVRYTRDGSFKAAANGTLTDQLGNTVLGTDRKPVKVNADGTVDAAKVGNFALTGATKQGDSYFTGTAAGAAKGEVQSGVPRGLRRRRRAHHGRHDGFAARLRGGPEGHPDDRRHAAAGCRPARQPPRLAPPAALARVSPSGERPPTRPADVRTDGHHFSSRFGPCRSPRETEDSEGWTALGGSRRS